MRNAALLCCALFVAAALGAEPVRLSVEDAVTMALGQSVELYGYALASGAALRDVENSWNLFLPSVNAGLQARYNEPLFSPDLDGQQASVSLSVNLSAQLSANTGLAFDLAKRHADYKAAALREREALAKIELSVTKSYFALVALSLDAANKARSARIAEERSLVASYRYERGLSSDLDSLRAEIAVENARAACQSAESEFAKRMLAFKRLLGLAPVSALELSSPMDYVFTGIDTLSPIAIAGSNFELLKLSLAVEAASAQARRNYATTFLPLLELGISWTYGLNEFDIATQKDALVLSAGLRFSPDAWLPGSAKDLAYRRLKEEHERLSRSLAETRQATIDDAEGLALDLRQAVTALAGAERQAELAGLLLERSAELYDSGLLNFLAFEEARQSSDEASQNVLSKRYQAFALALDIAYMLQLPWRDLLR